MQRQWLTALYEKSRFPASLADAVTETVSEIEASPELSALFGTVEDKTFGKVNTYPDILSFAAARGIDGERLALAYCAMMTRRSWETVYRPLGATEQIFYDSMRDIVIWAETFRRSFGRWGIPKQFWWVAGLLRGEVIRLGRLEFEQISHYPFDEPYDRAGVHLEKNTIVHHIHIPEDGPIRAADRLDSYRQAADFLGIALPAVFVCHSWLLYPPLAEMLPEGSNVVSFYREFDIVEVERQENHSDLWRVFGRRDSYDPGTLPRDTAMQRAYADYLARGGMMGSGFGVLLFDGEKVIAPEVK
ncbi:MAG: acyltransferase domain-containing protein [Clostridia bacterium]|nr:acyltransferase domain-containing protein [Clostridia bacterium]